MASDSGIRFIDDLRIEPRAVQEAVGMMIDEMRAERQREDRERAETKAAAVEAVESAIATASHRDPPSRLAG